MKHSKVQSWPKFPYLLEKYNESRDLSSVSKYRFPLFTLAVDFLSFRMSIQFCFKLQKESSYYILYLIVIKCNYSWGNMDHEY